MTDIEVIQATATEPPEALSWFESTMREAEVLARSGIVPEQYRNKPDDIVVAALYGRDFGWSPTTAMNSIHVVKGKPTLSAQAMVALVRGAGHSISGEMTATGSTVLGRRGDTDDTMTVEFTTEDAQRAGLTSDAWRKYPQSMCWARAVSQLCRMLFADVLLGISYTPEELTGLPEAPSAPEPEPAPSIDWDAVRRMLGEKVAKLDPDGHEHWEAWKTDVDHEGWQNNLDLLTAGSEMVNQLLHQQGVDPFLDDVVVDAEIVTDEDSHSSGDAGDGEANISADAAVESSPDPLPNPGRTTQISRQRRSVSCARRSWRSRPKRRSRR